MTENVPPLRRGDVHVWQARAGDHAMNEARLHARLDRTEVARAKRFFHPRDRLRFIVAHGLLRGILASYTGIDAARLLLECEAHGKPRLRRGQAPGLEFNLSHSNDVIAIAIARRPVGIDVERWSDAFSYRDLAERVFSPRERHTLAIAALAERCAAFFSAWTRKEAYLKATGRGITDGLARIDVPSAADGWTICDLDIAADYSGAIVAPGSNIVVSMFRLAAGDVASRS